MLFSTEMDARHMDTVLTHKSPKMEDTTPWGACLGKCVIYHIIAEQKDKPLITTKMYDGLSKKKKSTMITTKMSHILFFTFTIS